jgi:NADH-quinone oxidoreductase subunit L
LLAVIATGLGLTAGLIVWQYYQKLYAKDPKATEYTDGIASKVGVLAAGHKVLDQKYYLDHLYTDVIAGGTKGPLARAAYWINQNILDGVVNVAGKISVVVGRFIYKFIDQGVVDATVNASGRTASESGQFLRKSQTGQVREYAAVMFGAAVLLAAVFIFTA